MSELDRHVNAARTLFDALVDHYRVALTDGRQASWGKAAHSIIDLLEHERLPRDKWLDWLSENH